jgi:tetratricopeptide (TPR) repeat protein
MQVARIKHVASHPPVVIAILAVVAVLGFILVNRLVQRFAEQQKALARHLYAQGLSDVQSGKSDRAIEEYRAALLYDRDNFDYQLSLARALRDTGRTNEAEDYLITLWERTPQNSLVNLALGRLAARQGQVERATQYYHNAMYGVWASDPESNRLKAGFELIEFLLRENARPQALAELISLTSEIPHTPELEARLAPLFAQAGDNERALTEYDHILQHQHNQPDALIGAGTCAFNLARYRTAERYLDAAIKFEPQSSQAALLLDKVKLIMSVDPFFNRIPLAERERRMRAAFDQAGKRLDNCMVQASTSNTTAAPTSADLSSLKTEWNATKLRLAKKRFDPDQIDSAGDLVSQIEQQTAKVCGPPTGIDEALLLISQNPGGSSR